MYTVEISLHRYTMPEDRSDPAERRLAVAYSSTHRTPAAASRRLAELIGGGHTARAKSVEHHVADTRRKLKGERPDGWTSTRYVIRDEAGEEFSLLAFRRRHDLPYSTR